MVLRLMFSLCESGSSNSSEVNVGWVEFAETFAITVQIVVFDELGQTLFELAC